MALSTGNKVTWADIQSIYSNLNKQQSKFGITQTTAPSNPGVVKPSVVSNLKSFVFALSSSSWVSTSFVSSVFNLTVPSAGSLLKADPFNTINTALSNINNICVNFSTDFSCSNFSTDFSCSNFSTDFSCSLRSVESYSCFGSSDFNDYCNSV